MWRALSVARGDVVMFLDSDTTNFGRHFVYGMLGPLLDRARRAVREGRPTAAPDRPGRRRRSTTPAASPS